MHKNQAITLTKMQMDIRRPIEYTESAIGKQNDRQNGGDSSAAV
ncbi:hypothetical protein HMPREF0262_01437 [Clostridium sp. ATCC 29733]|nr:hypothetical protein HMPREF0262_01437 [Clostridium sp. ATCC 29733]